ncbi:hypothetical protein PWP93_25305 [Paraburkholderia sp. A1RI-2L]
MRDAITGREVARLGDMTMDHAGVRVAFIGDTTTCGATLQKGT